MAIRTQERCDKCSAWFPSGKAHRCVIGSTKAETFVARDVPASVSTLLPTSATNGLESHGRLSPATVVNRMFRKPLASEWHKTLAATKPWEALGMSRRTWFRRKKDGK